MGNFFNRLGFIASTIVDPIGRVGGIWIVWDTNQVNVRASSVNSQAIHATIHKEDYDKWVLAAVSASPNPVVREQLWDDLEAVAINMSKPWLVANDFNDYANQGERRSFNPRHNAVRNQKFLDRVNNCILIDLGSFCPKMTWTNNRQGLANTMERLDRAMSNSEWQTMFPEATVRVLPRTYSDHSPLLVYTQGMHTLNPLIRPFRFEAAWITYPGLLDVIKSSWSDMNQNLIDSTAEFTCRVKEWNKEVFGNIFQRKRHLLARIEGIQRSLANYFSHNLQSLEKDLIFQYNACLFQEEVLWFQKSRSKHITLGDRNSKYFHVSTITKRRKNKINALKDTSGNWITDSVNIKVINETLIVLIPKIDNPENIRQFRPISLCNVSYKIITKLIVGRIRPLLDNLICPNQSSFIPGRNTTDNIIITQEILHSLRNKKGTQGGMIFKIDLEKAYDRLSWDFIKATLLELKLNDNWIELIMSCVSNQHSSILWNGEIIEGVQNGRGLRQGDPLSPYLFVLCMERLSNMINFKVHQGSWKGIKASRNSPSVSHLFFADDLILFAQANQMNCDTIIDVLCEFCEVSGQKINYAKSKLFISPNIPRLLAKSISSSSGIPLTQDLGKYLGSPLLHKRVTKSTFNDILEKMKTKLSGWKAKNLTMAGRATLIQSVTSAIPSYNMQTMELPRKLCDEIDKLNGNFLWGDSENHKKVHLVNWDSVCKRKVEGGLGIRKARAHNAALLTKLGWKILCDKNKLWCKILHSKYLKHHSLFTWPQNKQASHIWRSIRKNRDILRKGVKWVVGNGEHISLWNDWWCGTQSLAQINNTYQSNDLDKVSSILDDEGNWDTEKLKTLVTKQDLHEILKIYRPRFVTFTDAPAWIGSTCGNFNTGSGFNIITNSVVDGRDWKWIWKDRNRLVFDNFSNSTQNSLKSIWDYVHEIEEAFQSLLHPHYSVPRLIKWCLPPAGKLKLNTDGCSKGDPGQARYGGLLQDETGTWIWGYYGKLGQCTSIEAEIWAIYGGLTILFQKGTTNVVIETDSEQAIQQIQHGPTPNSPFKALIEDAKFLLQRCDCPLIHTFREGNKVADLLANLGVAQSEHVLILEDPPTEATAFLIDDMLGVPAIRD
ncbi:uncharacterized protein LOC114259389 [Camellia sinensis]|uniref:uncharacterized protein LOC114259389 n=1 Tax=Camellia sinensis TaxID=4442 RepID=UPI0010368953|nr:uncharacterized protein LOC114259389 [Camellia sinensis]